MMAISPKGTVPVMQLQDGDVLEQSRDIMHWALSQNNPFGLLSGHQQDIECLLDANDTFFKSNLDRYKYPQRFQEENAAHLGLQARSQAEKFLTQLETRLQQHSFLVGAQISLADIGVMPFVRQFVSVDKSWFNSAPYPAVQRWLADWLQTAQFQQIMQKFKPWQPGDVDVLTPSTLPDDARYPCLYNAESPTAATHL